MHTKVRVKRKIEADVKKIQDVILSLQDALGERSQEGMARRLGCSLGAYSKWCRGEAIPGGKWLLKLIALCPDQETRAAFGLKMGPPGENLYNNDAPLPADVGLSPFTKQQRKDLREEAHHWIDQLFAAPAPDQTIRQTVELLRDRGGYWRRVRDAQKK